MSRRPMSPLGATRSALSLIAVDAPCRWCETGSTRPVEYELKDAGIGCFSTPTLAAAEAHKLNHFGWMLNGADLFAKLRRTQRLYDCSPIWDGTPLCFETFPHAIACELAGRLVSAKRKATVRRGLLGREGVDILQLTNIDYVDAAMCALTAHRFAQGKIKIYGESEIRIHRSPHLLI